MSAIRTSVLGYLETNLVWASGPRVAEAVALRRETVRDHLLAMVAEGSIKSVLLPVTEGGRATSRVYASLATADAVEPPRLAKYRNAVAWTEREAEGDVSLPEPGRTVVYHIGDLATDRAENGPLSVRADSLWRASVAGLVLLSQERVGPNRTVYRATGMSLSQELPAGTKHRALVRETE